MTKFNVTACTCLSLISLLGGTTMPAAFGQQFDLVVVDIKAVARDVAENINAKESTIPLTIQTPFAVASEVCGIAETVLRASGGGHGNVACVAIATSRGLEELVREKMHQ